MSPDPAKFEPVRGANFAASARTTDRQASPDERERLSDAQDTPFQLPALLRELSDDRSEATARPLRGLT